MSKRPNLVQIEFFHVGKNPSLSLATLENECLERIIEGSPIKTVVRLFDESGAFTKHALRFSKAYRKDKAMLEAFKGVSWLKKHYLLLRHYHVMRILDQSKRVRKALTVRELERAMRDRDIIAIENRGRDFRIMERNEIHELLEAARASTHIWIFVFKPNDILSDKNTGIAHTLF